MPGVKRERSEAKICLAIRRRPVENSLDSIHAVTCRDENLLKACASRQEKPHFGTMMRTISNSKMRGEVISIFH